MMDFFPSNYMLETPSENDHQPPSLQFHVQGLAEENLSDAEGAQAGEKKRRLNIEQVKTLENNFEMGSKLDLEKKMQLAKSLRLQPRQVAIWFQNRRARWKTKQLEKDYDTLKNQFDSLKNYNQTLLAQNQKLQAEISALKGRELINLNKETDQGCSSNSSDINLDISTRTLIEKESTFSSSHHQHPKISTIFFPPSSSSSIPTAPVSTQLFHSHRFDQPVKEESFTNMFTVMDDQPGFWPWVEPQQQHFN